MASLKADIKLSIDRFNVFTDPGADAITVRHVMHLIDHLRF
jgi:hypothetical protein